MGFVISILITGIAGLFGLVLAYISGRRVKSRKQALKSRTEEAKTELGEAQKALYERVALALKDLPAVSRNNYLQYLLYSQRKDGSFPEPPIIISGTTSKEETDQAVENRTRALEQRIQEVESRLPSDATIEKAASEKVASVNDAILAVNLESLAKSVKRLEDKMLSKWDMAKITFQILAALGGLVALVLLIINFVILRPGA